MTQAHDETLINIPTFQKPFICAMFLKFEMIGYVLGNANIK